MGNNLIKTLILLNSDEEARILSTLLGNLQLNLEITVATHIDQFLSSTSSGVFDCLILDWKYEHYAITELVTKLRASKKYHKIPIVCVVDKKDVFLPAQYSALNVDLLISRPFNVLEFEKQLTEILNKKLGRIIPEHFEILVLDDNPDILEIHVDNLKELKHLKYQTCSSIAEAEKLINEKDFDLFLLDWNLEDGTCIDLIEFIRSKKKNRRLNEALIMAVTGRDAVEDIMTLLKYNVKDYIIKPYGFSEFEEKLIYALERHGKELKKTI